MLPTVVVLEVQRLLELGQLSRREIARRLGVSRTMVQAIALGRRDLVGRINDELNFPQFATRPDMLPTRCGGCGGLVYLPCVSCRARRHRKVQSNEAVLGTEY